MKKLLLTMLMFLTLPVYAQVASVRLPNKENSITNYNKDTTSYDLQVQVSKSVNEKTIIVSDLHFLVSEANPDVYMDTHIQRSYIDKNAAVGSPKEMTALKGLNLKGTLLKLNTKENKDQLIFSYNMQYNDFENLEDDCIDAKKVELICNRIPNLFTIIKIDIAQLQLNKTMKSVFILEEKEVDGVIQRKSVNVKFTIKKVDSKD